MDVTEKLTDKQVESLRKRLIKAKPWKRQEALQAALDKLEPDVKFNHATHARVFRLIATGKLSSAEDPELELDLHQIALKAAEISRAMARVRGAAAAEPVTAEDVVDYLASRDESLFAGGQLLQVVGSGLIAALVYENRELFQQRIDALPESIANLVRVYLRASGMDVKLPRGFSAWFGRQFASQFPDVEVPLGSGWDGARASDWVDFVATFDHGARALTPSGVRFIELFMSVDEWRAARGANAYLPEVGA